MKKKFVDGCYCEQCGAWAVTAIWFCCPRCGQEDPKNFAVLVFWWHTPRFVWWRPLSWFGRWNFLGEKKAIAETQDDG